MRSTVWGVGLAAALLGVSPADAVSTLTTTQQGLRVSLHLPTRTYPRDSLQQFTMHVRNISNSTVRTSLGGVCFEPNPSVVVVNRSGHVTPQFPPLARALPCGVASGRPLRPGESWTGHVLAIVNGVSIHGKLRVGHRLERVMKTSGASVRLLGGGATTARIHHGRLGPFVVVPRPPEAHGPLYVLGSTYCLDDPARSVRTTMPWTAISGNRVNSPCSGGQEWYMYAGYVGYPITVIQYSSAE
jgi:hypothetical protein